MSGSLCGEVAVGLVFLASALGAGCLLAVQASGNQQLNKAVGTPYGASTVQLSVAAAALAVLAAATGSLGAVAGVPEVSPAWLLLGGIASPLYITAGILLFPRLGALTAVGLFVTGQVFASLTLDAFGLLAVPREPLSTRTVLGAVVVLAGIIVVIRAQKPAPQPAQKTVPRPTEARRPSRSVGHGDTPATATATAGQAPVAAPPASVAASTGRSGWVVLGLSAGAVLPVQGAINAQLQDQIGAPLAVGTISFIVATATIAALLGVLLMLRRTPTPRLRPLRSMPWWGWLGGFCAAGYVTATFLLLPRIGAAVTIALTVTGQQLASALIDQFGWLGMTRRLLTGPRLLGLALLVGGTAVVQLT